MTSYLLLMAVIAVLPLPTAPRGKFKFHAPFRGGATLRDNWFPTENIHNEWGRVAVRSKEYYLSCILVLNCCIVTKTMPGPTGCLGAMRDSLFLFLSCLLYLIVIPLFPSIVSVSFRRFGGPPRRPRVSLASVWWRWARLIVTGSRVFRCSHSAPLAPCKTSRSYCFRRDCDPSPRRRVSFARRSCPATHSHCSSSPRHQ